MARVAHAPDLGLSGGRPHGIAVSTLMRFGSRACLSLLAWFTAWFVASAALAASKSPEAERSREKSKQTEADDEADGERQAKNSEGSAAKAAPGEREQPSEKEREQRDAAKKEAASEAKRDAAGAKRAEDADEAEAAADEEPAAPSEGAAHSAAAPEEVSSEPKSLVTGLAAGNASAAGSSVGSGAAAVPRVGTGNALAETPGAQGLISEPAQPRLPDAAGSASNSEEAQDEEAADEMDSAPAGAEKEVVAPTGDEASASEVGDDVAGANPAVVGTLEENPSDSQGGAPAPGASLLPARVELQVVEGVLGEGTRWETEYFALESQRTGPAVIVISGMHGDELAGPLAAERLRSVELCAGSLHVLPRANVPALEAAKRRTPDAEHDDLNRNFPRAPDDQPRGEMATHLWEWVESLAPEVLLDLHEGVNYHAKTGRSVGNTILFVANERSRYLAMRMVVAANRLELNHDQRFRPWKPPVIGGIARATSDQLGAMGMILETTRKGPLERRVEQHWTMVTTLLEDMGMTGSACDMPLPEPSSLTAED